MMALDACDPEQIAKLPDSDNAIVVLEGLSMYLTNDQLHGFLRALQEKYAGLHILMDIYTVFGAKASRYKNPVNDVGVTTLYGVDNIEDLVRDLDLKVKAEHTMTPAYLVEELNPADKAFFKLLFTGRIYGKIYRLFELEREKLPHGK